MAIVHAFEQEFEFRFVDLEAVHLFVAQEKTADHLAGTKEFASHCVKTRVCGERFVRAYP